MACAFRWRCLPSDLQQAGSGYQQDDAQHGPPEEPNLDGGVSLVSFPRDSDDLIDKEVDQQ